MRARRVPVALTPGHVDLAVRTIASNVHASAAGSRRCCAVCGCLCLPAEICPACRAVAFPRVKT